MDAGDWDERYSARELVWSAGPNPTVDEIVADLTPGTAIDLAAGEGRHARFLAQLGWQVTAVDFSATGLDKGRQVAGDLPIDWVVADATAWVAPEPVDLVLVTYLHLVPAQRRAALRNAWRSLRPGGTLVWLGHDTTNLTEGVGGPQEPEVLMTAQDVLTDLDSGEAAYSVRDARRIPRLVADHGHEHDGPGPATAWDCLVWVERDS